METMDKSTALKLAELNKRFYHGNARSFSGTRQSGWPGWSRVLDQVGAPHSVLDVACGNARFKAFLDERPHFPAYDYHALDSCPELVPPGLRAPLQHENSLPSYLQAAGRQADFPLSESRVSFQCIDLVSALVEGRDLLPEISAPACDLVVCFGFMHHVPTDAARHALLDFLVQKTVPGGCAAVSFWQFARDERRRAKAQRVTERGTAALGIRLDANDYLLGWNDLPNVYRYCHGFADEEIDMLAESMADTVKLVDRFSSDGKTGDMNSYLVFRRTF